VWVVGLWCFGWERKEEVGLPFQCHECCWGLLAKTEEEERDGDGRHRSSIFPEIFLQILTGMLTTFEPHNSAIGKATLETGYL